MQKIKLSLREALVMLILILAIMGVGVIGLGFHRKYVLLAITVTIFLG